MAWKEVNPQGDLISWDEPKTLEGFYAGGEERTTKVGENTIHFLDANGERLAFFGTALLNGALKQVAVGQLVKIEYTGKQIKTSQGFRMKEFHVSVFEANEHELEPAKA